MLERGTDVGGEEKISDRDAIERVAATGQVIACVVRLRTELSRL